MKLAFFLHIYQPPTQDSKVLRKVTRQSYVKLVRLLEDFEDAKVTLNINASLTEQLARIGNKDLLDRIKRLAQRGQIEFTASAAYHPILPDLPKREIIRQINLNQSINQTYFGSAYETYGLFPPEMAYEDIVGEVAKQMGFKWILVDGKALGRKRKILRIIYRKKGSDLLLFPRNDEISIKIAFGRIKTVLGLIRAIGAGELSKDQYLILAMDGETFGHHQPKAINFLREIFKANSQDKRLQLVLISELLEDFDKRSSVEILPSTWGYTEKIDGEAVWVRWRNSENPVHKNLNRIRKLAILLVDNGESREILDRALNSDTYWWSSGKPFWHTGLVKRGTRLFVETILKSKKSKAAQKQEARQLYKEILSEGYRLYGKKKKLKKGRRK